MNDSYYMDKLEERGIIKYNPKSDKYKTINR
jgi:hypothetical protein